MSNRGEMWVHGNAARLQFPGGAGVSPRTPHNEMNAVETGTPFSAAGTRPWTDVVGYAEGNGISFRGRPRAVNYFHFAMPTPVVVPSADDELRGIAVDAISVLWNGRNAKLTNVFWFHGSHGQSDDPARHSGGTPPTGDNTCGHKPFINYFEIPEVMAKQGFGISVEITFDDSEDAVVTFTGAAIHYRTVPITLEDLLKRCDDAA